MVREREEREKRGRREGKEGGVGISVYRNANIIANAV
jgi:hypothetical protein